MPSVDGGLHDTLALRAPTFGVDASADTRDARRDFRNTAREVTGEDVVSNACSDEGPLVPKVAALPQSSEALLGPSAQRLDIGLLAARTAAILRRVADGAPLDEVDDQILQTASRVLESTAHAVQIVAAGGQLTREPGGLSFGAMAFTVEHAAHQVPPADVPDFFWRMAAHVTKVRTDRDVPAAKELLGLFSELARVATQQAGTVGEGDGVLF
jgi:hypothetical protein